jgi:nucleotide-binding universal stress UspA family protein
MEINSARGEVATLAAKESLMPIKDILLPLIGEPGDATIAAIDKCVAAAGDFGARVSAVVVEQAVLARPQVISPDLDNSGEAGAVRSVRDAQELMKAFGNAATRFGLRNEQKPVRWTAGDIPANLAVCARLKDLSLVPVKSHDDQSESIVEQLLFKSGRPILMCPVEHAIELPVAFRDVLIAWDHSAPAARAISDALPLLAAAETVRVITATDERTPKEMKSGTDLVAHLAEHGVKASFQAVRIEGSSVGKVLEAYVRANAIDLLVMGGYGHTRLTETVWGGVTKTVIGRPPCWVMMSR